MAMFELEGKKQESLVVRLGIPAVYGGVDVKYAQSPGSSKNPDRVSKTVSDILKVPVPNSFGHLKHLNGRIKVELRLIDEFGIC